jgi:hypothetical protein
MLTIYIIYDFIYYLGRASMAVKGSKKTTLEDGSGGTLVKVADLGDSEDGDLFCFLLHGIDALTFSNDVLLHDTVVVVQSAVSSRWNSSLDGFCDCLWQSRDGFQFHEVDMKHVQKTSLQVDRPVGFSGINLQEADLSLLPAESDGLDQVLLQDGGNFSILDGCASCSTLYWRDVTNHLDFVIHFTELNISQLQRKVKYHMSAIQFK